MLSTREPRLPRSHFAPFLRPTPLSPDIADVEVGARRRPILLAAGAIVKAVPGRAAVDVLGAIDGARRIIGRGSVAGPRSAAGQACRASGQQHAAAQHA